MVFYLEGHKTLWFGLFAEKQKRTKFPIFAQKPWTDSFGNMLHFRLLKSMFFSLKYLDFDLQGQKILRFRLSCHKTKQDKLSKFDQKLETPHFRKIPKFRLF